MATISLYAVQANQMPEFISNVKGAVVNFQSELSALKTSTLKINQNICDLSSIVSSIQASSQTQEEKADALDTFNQNMGQFIEDTVRIDNEVADMVRQRKDDFYEQYHYLKPACEMNGWEKFCDGCAKAGEWCKEHWKLIVTIVIVIAAVVVIVLFPAAAPILLLAAKGAILGAVMGGVFGGLSSLASGRSFWEGFEEGAFSGAISGVIFGGLGGAGRMFGDSCKLIQALGGFDKVFKVISCTAKISGGITMAMAGFDLLALGIGLFDPSNAFVAINQKLHSNKLYNAFQLSVAAIAAFTGGAYSRMRQGPPACFIAGTMILTVSGYTVIENIKAGDSVISTDPDTFEVAEKKVLETYVRQVERLVYLTVNGEEIVTTVDHPFYVKNRGFVNACDLQIGNKVINVSGDALVIENIITEFVNNPVTVYNFQVEDFHTYYVGNNRILVHNADYPKNPDELLNRGWEEVTPDGMKENTLSREFIDPKTGAKVRYDPGVPGADGYKGANHYHQMNPNATGKSDYYLDVNGNPVAKNSKASHIMPTEG